MPPSVLSAPSLLAPLHGIASRHDLPLPFPFVVIGAGVAGLQAVATARRLGAVVSAFDVRSVVKEQVQSLGASFVEVPQVAAEGAGGYAKELGASEQERVLGAIAAHVRDMDLVITTAQIPGRPAPRLLTAETIRSIPGLRRHSASKAVAATARVRLGSSAVTVAVRRWSARRSASSPK